jgi:hypothetical protein
MFSSVSNFKKLTKDGCEGEQTIFRSNSLQPRLVLISDDEGMSSVNEKVPSQVSKSSSMHSRVPAISGSQASTKRSIALTSPDVNTADRTKDWVSTSFVDINSFNGKTSLKENGQKDKPHLLKTEPNELINLTKNNDHKSKLLNKNLMLAEQVALLKELPNITCSNVDGHLTGILALKSNIKLPEEIPDIMSDVLSRYGIKKRASSVADSQGRKKGAEIGPIGPPKAYQDLQRRSHSVDYPGRQESISPINSYDDVFNDQNELMAKSHQPLSSTQDYESIMESQEVNTFNNGLQCQHEHWNNKSHDTQSASLISDRTKMTANNMMPSLWRNVENSFKSHSPCFLTPWTNDVQNTVMLPCDISPTNSSEEQDDSEQKRRASLFDGPIIQRSSFIKSPFMPHDTYALSEGNSSGENLFEQMTPQQNLRLGSNSNEDVRLETQFEQRSFQRAKNHLIERIPLKSGDKYISNKQDNSGRKDNGRNNHQRKEYAEDNPASYYGYRQGPATAFDENRSSFFDIWTPRRLQKQGSGNSSSCITPDNFNENGVEENIHGKCCPTAYECKGVGNNELERKNTYNDMDPEHLVRGLRKLAGENLPE